MAIPTSTKYVQKLREHVRWLIGRLISSNKRRHSWTLHRNYLLSISNNVGQVEDENSVVRVGPLDKLTPVPPADNGLLAKRLTKS